MNACTCTTSGLFTFETGRSVQRFIGGVCRYCGKPPLIFFNDAPEKDIMDPNETLHQIRELIKRIKAREDAARGEELEQEDMHAQADDAINLALYVEALDEWMAKGGFPPHAWKRKS